MHYFSTAAFIFHKIQKISARKFSESSHSWEYFWKPEIYNLFELDNWFNGYISGLHYVQEKYNVLD